MTPNPPEIYSITTPDGETYFLNTGNRAVLLPVAGFGLPPIDWDTYRAYKADKLTEIGYTLEPRSFQMQFREQLSCRDDYWDARAQLLDELRPNRSANFDADGQHIITIAYKNGSVLRSIYGRFNSPVMQVSDNWDDFAINEPLDVICFDPVWFEATTTIDALSFGATRQLVYPTEYGASVGLRSYGGSGSWNNWQIAYTGTWYTYPVITATGPFDSLKLEHQDTGAIIEYVNQVANGQTLIIDVENVNITLDGVDSLGFITPESDFVAFRIEPNNIAPDGLNTIIVTAPGNDGGVDTSFSLAYVVKYIGI